jgi:hypothetical protein
MAIVCAIPNLIFSPQQHHCKCKQVQALPTFYSFLRIRIKGTKGGNPNEQPKWNEENKSKVEDDTQPKMSSHPIIAPLEQFFDNELEVDNHPIIAPPKLFFDNELKFNEV